MENFEKVEAALARIEWPSKPKAERWEIENLIRHYQQLPGAKKLEIVRRGERPDWIVRDQATSELIGIELTSVYLHDRSVPDSHCRDGVLRIPSKPAEIAAYGERVAAAVQKKVRLARAGYRTDLPLILSLYANEYVTIHMDAAQWNEVIRQHEAIFDDMRPFREIIVWPLVSGGMLRIRPS